MRSSALIRSLLATAVLLLPSAIANPIEPSVPAVSHFPTPASDNLIIIYGTPSSDRTDQNLTAYHNPSSKAADSATQPSTISKRSYASTCDDCCVWGLNNDLFKCRCRAQNGEWTWSTVNLNSCLVNNDGYIQWRQKYGHDPLPKYPIAFVYMYMVLN
ncbi:hypothetical protein QBC37DRAFT_400154 [Rhypophila decipiens]|uniref:Cyanovirin-N domain-containing protein n=1 Tax=Rhypophila decipiens TaxID=261697 RepID=A0AAN6YC56_9PEZI|nr:hypothetical protein QBC37DRAFT_400154 [Rhypophila decipiens]